MENLNLRKLGDDIAEFNDTMKYGSWYTDVFETDYGISEEGDDGSFFIDFDEEDVSERDDERSLMAYLQANRQR